MSSRSPAAESHLINDTPKGLAGVHTLPVIELFGITGGSGGIW
jgi:hypothetical protein